MCACMFAHERLCWGEAVISLGGLQLCKCRHESSLALDIFRLEEKCYGHGSSWQMVLFFSPGRNCRLLERNQVCSYFNIAKLYSSIKTKNGDLSYRINYLCDMTGSNWLLKHHIGTIVGYFKMVGDIQIFHIWLCNS